MYRRESFRDERRKIKNRAGGFSYKPGGMNWPMPPRIINPPTARLTSRLCNEVFLRSAFKAQKPVRSRAKKIAAKDDRIQGKTKNLFSSYSGDGRGVEGSAWGGGERGSDKHTRYSNSPSCLLPACDFLIEGR